MQAGFQPGSHLGTQLDVPLPPAPGVARWKGSFAAETFKRVMDDPDATAMYDEKESSFRKFRPTLVGPTMSTPPTGGSSTAGTMVLVAYNPAEPDQSVFRPAEMATFLQPGAPGGKQPARPAGLPEAGPLTSSAPGYETVFRQAGPKTRPAHGEMSVARWEQQAQATRRKQARQIAELYAAPAAAATAPVVAAGASRPAGAEVTPSSTTSSPSNFTPTTTPDIRRFAKGVGNLLSGNLSSQDAQMFLAENVLWFVVLGLLLILVVMGIVGVALMLRRHPRRNLPTSPPLP